MARSALHSAVLEVGLFYEKGWSPERIARFTSRLQRRRRRAEEAAARADRAARRLDGEWLAVPFLIEAGPDPWVGFDVTPSESDGISNGSPREVVAGRQLDSSERRD